VVEGRRPARWHLCVCSASLKGLRGIDDAREVAQGSRPIRKLMFSSGRSTASMPRGIGLDDLSVLGPITLLKLKFSVADYDRSVVAEMWFYPDGYGSWSCPPSTRPATYSWPSPSPGRCWPSEAST
jgi:hypothetical protein